MEAKRAGQRKKGSGWRLSEGGGGEWAEGVGEARWLTQRKQSGGRIRSESGGCEDEAERVTKREW